MDKRIAHYGKHSGNLPALLICGRRRHHDFMRNIDQTVGCILDHIRVRRRPMCHLCVATHQARTAKYFIVVVRNHVVGIVDAVILLVLDVLVFDQRPVLFLDEHAST